MPFPKLELVKSQHRELAPLLDKMAEYVRRQTASGESFVVPKLAAAVLGINEGEAYVLLKLLAEGGLLKQQYNVYCRPQGMLLQSVDSKEELDNIQYCDFCDKQHEPSELTLEIAFRPNAGLEDTGLAA
jgi:hypothetical protein